MGFGYAYIVALYTNASEWIFQTFSMQRDTKLWCVCFTFMCFTFLSYIRENFESHTRGMPTKNLFIQAGVSERNLKHDCNQHKTRKYWKYMYRIGKIGIWYIEFFQNGRNIKNIEFIRLILY